MRTDTGPEESPSNFQAPAAPAASFLALRLAILVFLVFAVVGAWGPTFPYYLKVLQFAPEDVSWAMATGAIASLLAPIVWGQIADRWLPMQACLFLCALASAIGLEVLVRLREPSQVIWTSLATNMFLVPAFGLSSSLIFRHIDNPDRQFGVIRVWGTVGWMAAGLLLFAWFLAQTGAERRDWAWGDSLHLGAGLAVLLALYCWTLPHTPPLRKRDGAPTSSFLRSFFDAPLAAMKLFRQPLLAVFFLCMFALYVTFPFTTQINPLLLKNLGVAEESLPALLAVNQSTEVLWMILLPWWLQRFGLKSTMVFGLLAWVAGLFIFTLGQPLWLVVLALAGHGVFICCFLVAGQIYVNRVAPDDIRASAQGLIMLINGLGLLMGNVLVGYFRRWSNDRFEFTYGFASGVAAAVLVVFVTQFTIQTSAPADE